MVYIDAVHFETNNNGIRAVAKLKWTNSLNEQATKICTKQQMIDFINQNPNVTKTKYWKNNSWVVGEDVRVVDNSFLRTDSNSTKVDNLGALPEF